MAFGDADDLITVLPLVATGMLVQVIMHRVGSNIVQLLVSSEGAC